MLGLDKCGPVSLAFAGSLQLRKFGAVYRVTLNPRAKGDGRESESLGHGCAAALLLSSAAAAGLPVSGGSDG